MNRASPKDLRMAMELATSLMKAGILFIPVPVLGPNDLADLQRQSSERLEQIAKDIEGETT